MADNKYNVLYKMNHFALSVHNKNTQSSTSSETTTFTKIINIPMSDLLSISVINNYDTAMYPIIRLRIYSDLSTIIALSENPDGIHVIMHMYGIICDTTSDTEGNSSIKQLRVLPDAFGGSFKAYLENKNIPTSFADEYDQGLKKPEDLNVDRKVPITLFCYDESMANFMRKKVNSVFKQMDITSVVEAIFRSQGNATLKIDSVENQTKYEQILFPNLSIIDALSFLDSKYGLYPKGAQVYGNNNTISIVNSDVNNGSTPIPIHVQSYKNPSDNGGMRRIDYNGIFHNNTRAENVSVTTMSDIERVLNSETIAAINVNNLSVETSKLTDLYSNINDELSYRVYMQNNNRSDSIIEPIMKKITTPDILHKSKNKYIADVYNARITERVTRIDVAGSGMDALAMNIYSRFNVIFDTPIRGLSINQRYRPNVIIHVFSNMGNGEWFTVQTTMRLCSN